MCVCVCVCVLPVEGVLVVTESHWPVLPLLLEGGEGEESGEGLCCDALWAKPTREHTTGTPALDREHTTGTPALDREHQ